MILSIFLKLIVNYVIPIFIITMLLIFIQMLYLYSIIRNYKKYEDKNYLEKTEKNIKKFHFLQKIENYLMYVCNVIFCLTSIISFFVIGLKAGLLMLFISFIVTTMIIIMKTKVIPKCFSDLN